MKRFIPTLLLLLMCIPCLAVPVIDKTLSSVSATSDLGTQTVTVHAVNTSNDSGSAIIQCFFLHANDSGYDKFDVPGTVALYPAGAKPTDNTFTFNATLPVNTYKSVRLIFFQSGSGYKTVYGDATYSFPAPIVVTTNQVRVSKLELIAPNGEVTEDVTGQKVIPFLIKWPASWTVDDTFNKVADGMWFMAKGSGGFVQKYITYGTAAVNHRYTAYKFATATVNGVKIADGEDKYYYIEDKAILPKSASTGILNVQFGLFSNGWTTLQWLFPGYDFEVGGDSWIKKCPVADRPTVAQGTKPVNPLFNFFVGGNVGNATASHADNNPANYANANYYKLLKSKARITVMRENIDPDRINEPMYLHIIDSHVNAMWSAGMVPVLALQDEPKGATLKERDDKTVAALQTLLTYFKDATNNMLFDVPVNEPHLHGKWTGDNKEFIIRCMDACNAIVPGIHWIAGAEGYSKSSAGIKVDPLDDAHAPDYYAIHAYLPDAEAATQLTSVDPKVKFICEEYWGSVKNSTLQSVHGLYGVMAWAWGLPGQDGQNLVQTFNEASASMTFTTDKHGEEYASDYTMWGSGKLLPTLEEPDTPPVVVTPPVVTNPDGTDTTQNVTLASLAAGLAAVGAGLVALSNRVKTVEDKQGQSTPTPIPTTDPTLPVEQPVDTDVPVIPPVVVLQGTATLPIKINCGGLTTIVGGFDSEAFLYTGGKVTTTNHAIDVAAIGAAPEAVYKSLRYGDFSYTVSDLTPGEEYLVRLHFSENYFNLEGKRIFAVIINGITLVSNLDVFKWVTGNYKALVMEDNVNADASGKITIKLKSVKDNAILNAFEILEA